MLQHLEREIWLIAEGFRRELNEEFYNVPSQKRVLQKVSAVIEVLETHWIAPQTSCRAIVDTRFRDSFPWCFAVAPTTVSLCELRDSNGITNILLWT